MSGYPKQAYRAELQRVAKSLGLSARGNLEDRVIKACKVQLGKWVAAHGRPGTLTELIDVVAASLSVRFVEIHDDGDLAALLEEIPPSLEPIMAKIPEELDDDTDGILILRKAKEAWERTYLAIVNCRGWHAYRAYFTKWHELSHLITDGKQMTFAFRKTKTPHLRKEPVEVLVDRVAAELAFYDEMFVPVFNEELRNSGLLSFEFVDAIRNRIAPGASRHATLLACLKHYSEPCFFVQCQVSHKKKEERIIQSGQQRLPLEGLQILEPNLRVKNVSMSATAVALNFRIHNNMRIPSKSIISEAWNDIPRNLHRGRESIKEWETSSDGPIGSGIFEIEAQRVDGEVWAIIHAYPS